MSQMQVVAGRIENPVQRQRQLDDPEVAAQVAGVGVDTAWTMNSRISAARAVSCS